MELFPTTNNIVSSAVLSGESTVLAVVSMIDVDGEYANGEYAFGVTLAKVHGYPSSGAETFYLVTGDLPNGEMLSCVFSQYTACDSGVEVWVNASYDWCSNSSTTHPPAYSLWLPSLCAQGLSRLDAIDPQQTQGDGEFDMDVVEILEDCGFWPWSFHFADPTTNFID